MAAARHLYHDDLQISDCLPPAEPQSADRSLQAVHSNFAGGQQP